MADIADQAQQFDEVCLAAAQYRREIEREPERKRGECAWCGESIADNAVFCGTECRDDDRKFWARRNNGG